MEGITKHTFSAHKFFDMSSLSFSAIEYSKFKFGSKEVARKFGNELANKFLTSTEFLSLASQLKNRKIVIASAPWKNIPVASTALKDYFMSRFNPIWSHDNPALLDLKIYRGHSYNQDYGNMNEADRDAAINADDFHIDSKFIEGKILFLIDDVRITGSHERRMERLLEAIGFQGTVVFLYFAEYLGSGNPNIENDLNFAFVKNILCINQILQNDEFIFNTRTVKYILDTPHEKFVNFIDYQSKQFCHSLCKELTGNEYHKLDEFKENYKYLITKLQ